MTDRANKSWSATELAYLRSHYGQKPSHLIAKKLGRSVGAIRVVASKFGIVSDARDAIEDRTATAWSDILGVSRQCINIYVRNGELRLDDDSKATYFRTQVISEACIEDWLRRGYALRCTANAQTPKYLRNIIAEVKAQYISTTELRRIDGLPNIRNFNGAMVGIGKADLHGICVGVRQGRDVWYRKADVYEGIYTIGHIVPRSVKDPYVKAVLMAWDSVYVATWQLLEYYRPNRDRGHPPHIIRGVYNRAEVVAWLRTRREYVDVAHALRQDPITWQELHADIDRRKRLGQPL